MKKSIKLIRMKLVNFARIKSGMGVNALTVDFTKLPNILSLIVGSNGSGKTSLMQCIHPFPYNTCTGDSGGNAQLIIEGMDGEKVFEFEYDGCIYKATHKYIRKKDKSLTTKSYLEENGEILDDSGSVNSFKECMAESFGLKESHFNILIIGNSLSSFVSSTAAERKKISVKLFEILDVYSIFYKNASDKIRELRPVLQNATAKLAQYKGVDIYDLEKEETRLEESISDAEHQLANALIELGEARELLKSNQKVYEEKKQLEKELRDKTAQIDINRSKAPDKSVSILESELTEITLEMERLTVSLEASVQLVQTENRFKDDKLVTIATLEQTSEKIKKDIDIRELEELRLALDRQIDELNIPPEIDSSGISSNALLTAKIYLDGLQGRCIDLITQVEHYDDVVIPVLEMYLKDAGVVILYEKEYMDFLHKLQIIQSSNAVVSSLSSSDLQHLFRDTLVSNCSNREDCPYVKFFHSIKQITMEREEETAAKLENATTLMNMARSKHNAAQVIKKLYQFVLDNKDIIAVINSEIFNPKRFIVDYMESRKIYNEDLLNHAIDIAERVEQREKLSAEIEEVTNKISALSNNRNSYTALTNQINDLKKDIESINSRVESIQKDIDYKKDRIKNLENKKRVLVAKLDVAKQLETLRADVQDIQTRMIQNEKTYKMLEAQSKNCEESSNYVDSIQGGIKKLKERLQDVKFTRTTKFNLMREEADISHKLVEYQAIREAVSATDGIPVEFIETFIKNELIQMVNEVLDVVYGGQLVLDKDGTIVDDTDFKIPYFWKGTWVSDISNASDGQKAVMTIAFSEVLVILTQMKYNILMFDEMDTTLDARSKAKIIQLMEWYEHQVKPSNMFTISHNPMFDGYPVNILLTSDEVINNVDQSNVVRCYEGGNE